MTRKPFCDWTDDKFGTWLTSCDNLFQFTADGPRENGFTFCPYCGHHLKVKRESGGAHAFENQTSELAQTQRMAAKLRDDLYEAQQKLASATGQRSKLEALVREARDYWTRGCDRAVPGWADRAAIAMRSLAQQEPAKEGS